MRRLWAMLCRALLVLASLVFAVNIATLGLQYPAAGALALLAATWRKLRRRWPGSDAFGTAAFAGMRDLIRSRLLGESGLILGRLGFLPRATRGQALRSLVNPFVNSEQACRQCFAAFFGARWGGNGFIRITDFVHLLTCSPAGGGKSVGVLCPNLLSYEGNCVVVDPKGELFRLTNEHRSKIFGHQIVRIDPALLCGPGEDCFNPLDWINPRALDFIDMCRDLANMLVVRSGLEQEPHWNDSAENVISAFIAYVCASEGDPAARNLRGMRTFIASRPLYAAALERMQRNEDFYGVLQQLGHSLTWHVDKELGSVMSHTQRHTNIFDSPLIAGSTERTSFDPRELRSGRRITLYLIVPGDKLVVWAAFQRVILGSLLRIATRGVPTERHPLLFLIDEAAHIGPMQALEDAVTLMRGMGIRLWFFFQSLDQLNKCFGERASTVLDNLATQQYVAINSYATAEALSKRIGDGTIAVRSTNDNTGISTPIGGDGKNPGSRSSGGGSTTSEHGRPLLRPDEILRMPDNVSLLFHKNMPVIPAERIRYYADPAFRRGRRGYGTGRSRGLGLGGMALALVPLLVSGVVTAFVASLPAPPARRRPATVAPDPFDYPGTPGGFAGGFGGAGPLPVEPWRQPPLWEPARYRPDWRPEPAPAHAGGRHPLPYRRRRRSYP